MKMKRVFGKYFEITNSRQRSDNHHNKVPWHAYELIDELICLYESFFYPYFFHSQFITPFPQKRKQLAL